MTQSFGPFVSGTGASFSEAQWREFFGNMVSSGVVKGGMVNGVVAADCLVSAPGSVMSVNVGTGLAIVNGFYFENDTTFAQTIAAADPTNPRIDRIVIELLFSSRTVAITRLAGTPASSPAAPNLTQNATVWDIPLAQVRVNANATQITSGNVTDERAYAGSLPPKLQGPGSGLNADTLDGLNSGVFAQGSSANQHLVTLNRAPTNADGNDGDWIIQW